MQTADLRQIDVRRVIGNALSILTDASATAGKWQANFREVHP